MSEDWTVAKILIELAKAEGFDKVTEFKINGKDTELTKEVADKLNLTSGNLILTYMCPVENINAKVWEKLGKKYVDPLME